jgi:hypothetical protein
MIYYPPNWKKREDYIDNYRGACCNDSKPECVPNQPITRCDTCGKIRRREISTMHCVLCEKLILRDTADLDEMIRLQEIGELELRTLECSFDREYYVRDKETGEMVKMKERRTQKYPICGDCLRKEKAEEEAL